VSTTIPAGTATFVFSDVEDPTDAVLFGTLNPRLLASVISGVTVPHRLASRRVLKKSGVAFQEEVTWRGTMVVWYAIDRPHNAASTGT